MRITFKQSNMEAKDKAKALYSEFFKITPQPFQVAQEKGLFFSTWDKDWTHNLAKQCALIACAEAKMVCPYISTENRETREQVESSNIYFLSFWEDVENEINQL